MQVTGSAVFYVQSVGSSHSSCDLGRRRDPELKKESSGVDEQLTEARKHLSRPHSITYLFVLPADISKVMQAKKKRLECLTKNYMKGSQHKLEQLWNNYHSQRQKMTQQYSQQVSSALQQWETEAQRAEEQEEKLNNLFRQQQKVLQQARVVQNQKLKTVRELYEQFVKVNLVEVGGCFCEQKPVYEETHQLESSDKLSVMFLLFLLQLQWSRSSSATMMKPPCVHYRWMKTRRWPAACR
uniref:Synaptonemal complex protein 3 n=1 Tax=Neolamprologus brichardi TaxID=32507 RepID=A0A3Q4GF46_NEOBR